MQPSLERKSRDGGIKNSNINCTMGHGSLEKHHNGLRLFYLPHPIPLAWLSIAA
jgi:hypothetical protein